MKKRILTLSGFLFLSFLVHAQEKTKATEADYQRAVDYLSYTFNRKVKNNAIRPNWTENGNFWYKDESRNEDPIALVNSKNGKTQYFSSSSDVPGYEQEERPQISRNEVVSPDEKKSVYIHDWNLWMRNLETGDSIQLTQDGEKNYGYATDNAGWRKSDRPIVLWSPNSEKIATYKQDQRHVSDMYLVTTNVGAPTLQEWKYPLPEDEKVIQIERVIIDTEAKEVVKLDIPADPRRATLCDDISCSGSFDDNDWSEDSEKLFFVSSSRDHRSAKLRVADAETGKVKELFEEKSETQYESGQGSINWAYLDDSEEIIWYSERDDWGHLYLYDAESGKLKNQITKGEFVVTEIEYIDEDDEKIYFKGQGYNKGENPYFSHLFSVDFNGKNLKDLTPEKGNHSISWSHEKDFFVDNYSTPSVPNKAVFRNSKGKSIAKLADADISEIENTAWKPAQEFKVKSADGQWDLYGLMFTPSNLDESKKYPVVNYIYPGPQGGSVGSWSFGATRGDHQSLAELGFVVIVLEGSCNPGRSKSFHDACYGSLSTNTLPDQISGIKQLAEKHSFIDTTRVGVWGHSGGGSATVAALFKYPDFYDVGVAQSGNHDNRNYEDDWAERYIGLMDPADSTSAYYTDANAQYAENLEGKLMLAHGAMDDNVPPYHTMLVVDALIKANKDFDLIIFPHSRHGYGQDTLYMMRRRWDYFVEHLLGATPPDNFEISLN